MWNNIKNVQIFLQSIRPTPIQYSSQSQGFHENLTPVGKRWTFVLDCNVGLMWLAAFVQLTSRITEESAEETDQADILNMVLQYLFLAMYTLVLSASWTFRFRGPATIWMIENSYFLSSERKSADNYEEKRAEEILYGSALYGVVVVCFSGSFIHGAMPLITNSTPGHTIFKWIIPGGILKDMGMWYNVVCCSYMGFIGFVGVLPIIQALMFQCGFLYESQFTLKPVYGESCLTKAFAKYKTVYHQSFLFIQGYNRYGYVWFSGLMGSAFFLNVISTLICIRFHSVLHPLLLGFFVGFDVICGILTVMIHAISMLSSEEAAKFLGYWAPILFSRQ